MNPAQIGRTNFLKVALVTVAGYPKSQVTNCDSHAQEDGIEQTVTAGASSLSYDAKLDQYTYVWKTERTWSAPPVGPCRQLVITLNDGSFHKANFIFKWQSPRRVGTMELRSFFTLSKFQERR